MSDSTLSTAIDLQGALTTTSATTLDKPGDLGRRFSLKDHALTVGSGVIKSNGGFKTFQVVKRDPLDATTMTIGVPVYWLTRTTAGSNFTFTADASEAGGAATTTIGAVAGVALGASPAAGKYGFIQVGGLAPFALKGSPTVAASATGLPIIPTTTDLEFDTVSTVTATIAGFCLTAKNATVGGGAIGTNVVLGILAAPVWE